jgi:hypothetical protein
VTVTVARDMPDMVWGDVDRLTQIFVYFAEYVIGSARSAEVEVAFGHEDEHLVGRIAFADVDAVPGWKLDLLMGLSGDMRRPFASDALGPLIARGLLGTVRGLLTLAEDAAGRRVVRVAVPARRVAFEKIRIHLETRSAALETLYRVALRSDRVEFLPARRRRSRRCRSLRQHVDRRLDPDPKPAGALPGGAVRLDRPAGKPGLLRRDRRRTQRHGPAAGERARPSRLLTSPGSATTRSPLYPLEAGAVLRFAICTASCIVLERGRRLSTSGLSSRG